jgi:hypothetical protein
MNALNRERVASMIRRVVVMLVAAFTLVSAQGCSSASDADSCVFQIAGFGGYAVKMTLQGSTAGCPATIGDVWYNDIYAAGGTQVGATWIWNSGSDDTISTPRPPSDPAFGRGKFTNSTPDANMICTMPTITPFVVRSTTPNSTPSGTYTVTNVRALGTPVYTGQQFVADVTFTGGTCNGGKYVAQGMTPPVQCTDNVICNPFTQPSNAINTGFNQGCTKDPWTQQAIVAQNKAIDIYNNGTDPAKTPQPDPGTGLCFLKEAFPSLGTYSP